MHRPFVVKSCDIAHSPRLEMTRETSSTASSSATKPDRPMVLWAEPGCDRDPTGEAYTLGNNGTVADVGLEPPVSKIEFSGDSGRERRDDASLIRVSDMVRSRD